MTASSNGEARNGSIAATGGGDASSARSGCFASPIGTLPMRHAQTIAASLAAVVPAATPANARADQGGVAFWFSGQFASLARPDGGRHCRLRVLPVDRRRVERGYSSIMISDSA